MISIRRIQAIFVKDWKDLLKNSYMLFTVAFPLLFAAWVGRMEEVNMAAYMMPVTLALVIGGSFIQAAMVAEEKEKNTLRSLMLSPVSIPEIFIGKSLLSALLTVLVVIGSIYLSGFMVPSSVLLFGAGICLSLIIYIAIGTILGLLSRTVMETSIVGMPVLILFGMGTVLKEIVDNQVVLTLLEYLPNEQFHSIVSSLQEGQAFREMADSFLILCIWAAGTIIVTVFIYRRRRFDD